MRKLKSPSRRHVETELTELRAMPQVLNVAALERGEALLAGFHGDLSTDETLYVLRLCASGCQAAGRWLEGLQFARRGLDLATREHKVRDKIPLLAISGNIHLFLQNFHLAIRAMREAIAIAEQEQLPDEQAKLLQSLGPVYSHLELHETALSVFERAFSMATSKPLAAVRAAALNNMAREFCALGRTAEAATRIDDAMAIAQAPALREWLPNLLHTRAEVAARQGRLDDAIADADAAAVQLRSRRNVHTLLRVLIDCARWLAARGRHDEARTRLDEASLLPADPSLHAMREDAALARVQLERGAGDVERTMDAVTDFLAARADAHRVHLASQRVAVQFVDEVERTEARGRRESAAVNELTLRLIETQAEAQKMARQVARDPLTGALNRGAFEAAMGKLAGGPQQPVALIMIDVDDFRAVNTECGHLAGDAVLEGVVERLRQALRVNDLMGRAGDDEFLVLCPGVGPRIAAAIASRVLAKVAETPVVHDGKAIAVTVSVGVACAHSKALASLPYLLKRVDAALRRAKQAGKNRAVTVRVND